MKKMFSILVTLLLSISVFAQAPQKMSYQAVIRNTSNQLVVNKTVGMKISILQASVSGTLVYSETQTPTTNANGLISIEIGGGVGFETIPWNNAVFFIKTETDPEGSTNYTITGTSQLLSVPYALAANTSNYTIHNGYTKMWVFDNPGKYSFSINASEGNYMVEVWGAGGGGFGKIFSVPQVDGGFEYYPFFFSGGGGGYAKSIFHLKNGEVFQVLVGAGGSGNSINDTTVSDISSNNGGSSSFDNGSGISVKADGGEGGSVGVGADLMVPSIMAGGNGYGQLSLKGNSGYSWHYCYEANNSHCVNGGNSPNGGTGGQFGSNGNKPGGGGSAGYSIEFWESVNDIEFLVGAGSNGMVVIYSGGQ